MSDNTVYVLISWGSDKYEHVIEGIFSTPELAKEGFQIKRKIFKKMGGNKNHIGKYRFEIREVELNQNDLNIKRCNKISLVG